MKKIIITIVTLIVTTFFTVSASAFTLDSNPNTEDYNILATTKSFYINYGYDYEIKYNQSLIEIVTRDADKTELVLLSSSDTNTRLVVTKDNSVIKYYNLNFVVPTNITLGFSDGYYYVLGDGEKLYGDFNWIVDGNLIVDDTIKTNSESVCLEYENKYIYYIEDTPQKNPLRDYVLVLVGLPLLALVIVYIIYLLLPINIYKRINRISNRIYFRTKKQIVKNKSSKKIILSLKIDISNLSNAIEQVPKEADIYKQLIKIKSDIMIVLDNVVKLGSYFPDENTADLVYYLQKKLVSINTLLADGTYNYKVPKKPKYPKVVVETLHEEFTTTYEMDKSQADAYHYLEKVEIIKKD